MAKRDTVLDLVTNIITVLQLVMTFTSIPLVGFVWPILCNYGDLLHDVAHNITFIIRHSFIHSVSSLRTTVVGPIMTI